VSLALAIAIVTYLALMQATWTKLGTSPAWYDNSPAREFLLFAIMLCGMGARVLSAAIEARRAKTKEMAKKKIPSQSVPLELDPWESAYPLLFAVMTFGALLAQVGAETLTITTVVLAFQTGFFWQTILKHAS
jgi:hypothetical protein